VVDYVSFVGQAPVEVTAYKTDPFDVFVLEGACWVKVSSYESGSYVKVEDVPLSCFFVGGEKLTVSLSELLELEGLQSS